MSAASPRHVLEVLENGGANKAGGAEQRQDDALLEALLEDAIGAYQEIGGTLCSPGAMAQPAQVAV